MMEVPELDKELDRKTLNELERVVAGLQTRKVGLLEAAYTLRTVWGVVAGLIPRETMDILGKTAHAVGQRLQEKRMPDSVVVLLGGPGGAWIMRRDAGVVTLQSWVGPKMSGEQTFKAPDTEAFPEKWASELFESYLAKFVNQGFQPAFRL